MQIHNKPVNTKPRLEDYNHISKTNDKKYTIRCMHDGVTYYYGSYTNIEEAIQISLQLEKRQYPIELSQQKIKKRSMEYKKILIERLQ